MTEVKVRILPPDTPGVPAPVPYHPVTGYAMNGECGVVVSQEDMSPEAWAATYPARSNDRHVTGFYCTLPPHGDTPHAAHARLNQVPVFILVWGGE